MWYALGSAVAMAGAPTEVAVGDLVVVDGSGSSVTLRVVEVDGSPSQAGALVSGLGGNVTVRSPIDPSRAVFVAGEVARPGAVTWAEGLTLTQAITSAGGWTRLATLRSVVVLRGDEALKIDAQRIYRGRDTDLRLQPGDRLTVPVSLL